MYMEKKEDIKETEIDLSVILEVLKKNVLPLILVTVLFGAGAFLGTNFFIAKQYKASATLIVNNKANNSNSGYNSNEIVAAQNLADVYSIIIKSESVLQPVIDKMEMNMTYEQLKSAITVSTVNSTQIIEVSVLSTEPEFAKKIVENVVKVAQPIITDKVEAGSVKVIDEAKISNNGNPVGPNASKNALIGVAMGFVVTLLVIFVKEFFNKRFKSETDVTNTLNLPLIGIIPQVDGKEFGK